MTVQAAALRAEGEENTEREPFTPGEAVRHRKRLEAVEAAAAKARQREHARTAPGRPKNTGSNLEQVKPEPTPAERKTRALTAKGTGYSATSLDKAQKVVEAAEQDPSLRPVVEEMNRTGKIDPAYRKVEQRKAAAVQSELDDIVAAARRDDPAVAAAHLRRRFSSAVVAVDRALEGLDPEAVRLVVDQSLVDVYCSWADHNIGRLRALAAALGRPQRLERIK